ncbi:MAG TPA: DUF4115 domain-containing protein, partial [Hydrogenophaga sp.]|nr:DUF4115 domain-containing protein [Hydrogenophaga sp.]
LSTAPTSSSEDPSQMIEPVQLEPAVPEGAGPDSSGVPPLDGAVEEGSDASAAGQSGAGASPEQAVPGAQDASTSAPVEVQAPDVPAASTALLRISAVGESWVEVTNGAGAVVVQRVLKQGDVIEFSSAPPYKVILGRAEAAQVFVRGKTLDVMPYARNSVARFEVK